MGLCKRITTYRSSIKEVTGDGNVLLKVPLLEYKEYMRKKKEKESPPPGTVTQMDTWLGNRSAVLRYTYSVLRYTYCLLNLSPLSIVCFSVT